MSSLNLFFPFFFWVQSSLLGLQHTITILCPSTQAHINRNDESYYKHSGDWRQSHCSQHQWISMASWRTHKQKYSQHHLNLFISLSSKATLWPKPAEQLPQRQQRRTEQHQLFRYDFPRICTQKIFSSKLLLKQLNNHRSQAVCSIITARWLIQICFPQKQSNIWLSHCYKAFVPNSI